MGPGLAPRNPPATWAAGRAASGVSFFREFPPIKCHLNLTTPLDVTCGFTGETKAARRTAGGGARQPHGLVLAGTGAGLGVFVGGRKAAPRAGVGAQQLLDQRACRPPPPSPACGAAPPSAVPMGWEPGAVLRTTHTGPRGPQPAAPGRHPLGAWAALSAPSRGTEVTQSLGSTALAPLSPRTGACASVSS